MDFCAGDTVATVDATVLAEVLDVQPIPMKGLPAGWSVTTYMQPRVEIDKKKGTWMKQSQNCVIMILSINTQK